jgi:uncharacterized sporulation protein YeaH/YhbH (DUF444 family)
MSETLKSIGAIFGILIPIIGFVYWHFKAVHSFKEQVTDLKLQMKELENKDNLQQQTIDQLKELYPLFKQIFESLNNGKK